MSTDLRQQQRGKAECSPLMATRQTRRRKGKQKQSKAESSEDRQMVLLALLAHGTVPALIAPCTM